ncbi:Proteasome subunit beta type [Operophtera brumata]|uniref:Proteasome subunit beta n=1 Tax=Operophtera brumata TaxID=104452 RepID=A0A0L7L453_OPEBR|nr:Proteasome subunit beta type [Operophtera brumata]
MASVLAPEIPAPGFSFENCQRNAFLANKGFPAPKATKTGTTIVGIIYADGVILGADTRATEDKVVSDKNCEKIHYLAGNMYCCGAGTAADTEMTTQTVSSQLELQRLHTGRTVPVETAATLLKRMLFRYQGHIGAALVLGGVDRTGSGSLAAMAVFEAGWRKNLSEEEGKKLVRDAIAAGIFNDLGSGSNVDLCVIRNSGPAQYLRTYEEANVKGKKQGSYRYAPGTTAVLRQKVIPLEVESVSVRTTSGSQPMDVEPSHSRR